MKNKQNAKGPVWTPASKPDSRKVMVNIPDHMKLNVRSTPSQDVNDENVIGTLNSHAIVDVVGEFHPERDFTKIVFNGQPAYVMTSKVAKVVENVKELDDDLID